MTAKHTPRPWRVIRASDYTDDPKDTTIQSITSADGTMVYFTDSGYFKPKEADVALIAAAPELLAALEELQDYAASALQELDASATGWYYQLQRAAQKASAAIAKAKGDA